MTRHIIRRILVTAAAATALTAGLGMQAATASAAPAATAAAPQATATLPYVLVTQPTSSFAFGNFGFNQLNSLNTSNDTMTLTREEIPAAQSYRLADWTNVARSNPAAEVQATLVINGPTGTFALELSGVSPVAWSLTYPNGSEIPTETVTFHYFKMYWK